MYLFLCLFIMAIVTYLIRMIPFSFFNKEIKSTFVKSLLEYIPYTILGAMTFPSIFYSTKSFAFSVLGAIVAIILAFYNKKLLTVAMAAIFTILSLNIIF